MLGCSPNELGYDSPAFAPTLFGALSGLPAAFGLLPAGKDIYAGALNPLDSRQIAVDIQPHQHVLSGYATFTVNHEVAGHTLSYVGGYSDYARFIQRDWDGSALTVKFARPITYSISPTETVTTDQIISALNFYQNQRLHTHELRLVSDNQGRFSYATGLFALRSVSSFANLLFHPYFELYQQAFKLPPVLRYYDSQGRDGYTNAEAWFGESQWKFSDTLRATAGARYTHQSSGGEGRTNAGVLLKKVLDFAQKPSISESKWTYRTALDWQPQPDMLVFGSIATGFKGGGSNAVTVGSTGSLYASETVTAYEMGTKAEFLDRTLRANVSVFYNDYKNMQLGRLVNAASETFNADATTQGAEFEFAYAPSRPWLFDASVSLLRTALGHAMTADIANPAQNVAALKPEVQIDLKGKELAYAPRTKVKLGAQYQMALGSTGWMLTSRIDHAWQAAYWVREFNTGADRLPAWNTTNLQWSAASPGNHYELKLWVKNVFDKDNLTGASLESELLGRYRSGRTMDPRTIGLEATVNF